MCFDVTLINNFQYQREFVDAANITRWDQSKNIQITDISQYLPKSQIH
jgi:hypothetical protein